MQADWTGLYNMRNTVFATAGKAREVNVFWTALVRKRTRKSINTSSQKIWDTRPRYRLWLWMPCPKRWKLRHCLLDVAFPAASSNTCNWLHCIFHESTGQEEVDPLSIAAEDSRLMWAQYCLVKYCGGEPTCESYLQAWYWQAVGETRSSFLRVVFWVLVQFLKEVPHKHRDRPGSPNNESNETAVCLTQNECLA